MKRTTVTGIELAYEVAGSGEPVLLVHGAHIADALAPLVREPALEGFQLIRYHRRGYGESSRPADLSATTMADQAADAAGLLDWLGIDRAHLVGQSSGGSMALEAAARYSDRVVSLALLEPVLATASMAGFVARLTPIVEQYQRGDAAGAVRAFLSGVGDGADPVAAIQRAVPGGVDQAIRDAQTFFEGELPASATWTFGADEAARITCPVLSVVGSASTGMWVEGRQLLHDWFPDCADADIAGVDHALQMANPAAVADALARFFSRVPAAAGAGQRKEA